MEGRTKVKAKITKGENTTKSETNTKDESGIKSDCCHQCESHMNFTDFTFPVKLVCEHELCFKCVVKEIN